MSNTLYATVLTYLIVRMPLVHLRSEIVLSSSPLSIPFRNTAEFFDYVTILQHRYYSLAPT